MNISASSIVTSHTKIIASLIASLGLILGLIALSDKAGAASVTATCGATATLNLSPGLQLIKETQGTNQSFGETGTLRCSGKLDGQTITGPGTIGFSAIYKGTCLAVTGGGAWFFTIPTAGGLIHREGIYSGPSIGSTVIFDGSFPGGTMKGAGPVVPVTGSCVPSLPLMPPPAPLTKGDLTLVGLQMTQ